MNARRELTLEEACQRLKELGCTIGVPQGERVAVTRPGRFQVTNLPSRVELIPSMNLNASLFALGISQEEFWAGVR